MHAEAVRLGASVVEAERRLDALFACGDASADSLQRIVIEVAERQGRYRAAHLQAHLELRPLLSTAQIARYNELRSHHSPVAK